MNSLDIHMRHVEGAAVIYPGAYLNQLRGESIERCCLELLDSGVRHIVINFSETELINSIGISILLGVIEAVNEARGTLVLASLNPSNRELFAMLGLDAHVRIADGEEAALSDLYRELQSTAV
ncbi:MAG TPA: STAS domain-containing protein [Blastocatellia bacterium]|nr:STAS domain-containing protein [Blastocatellia bacterium]